MSKSNLLVALAALMVFVLPGYADDKETSRDEIIAADVFRVIEHHVFYTPFDVVFFDVKGGVVTLSGYATHPYKRSSFENAVVKKVEGVKEVVNRIEVLPPSYFDDQIRYVIASRIFNDGRLLRYAITDYRSSIHIVVRNGSVTLEGFVANEMDRKIVETNARGINGVVSVTNNLKVE